jgi:uncharacterized membrane protein
MKKSHIAALLIFLIAIPATLVLGLQLPGRWYLLTSFMVIAEILLPFFLAFEGRRPQARELVLMAVMCALAVAARVVIAIPNFKAIYGVVMIAGIALGAEPGFLVGAVAAFVSNFFRGQGIWTPWQMLAYGGCGMLMGFLFRKGKLPRKPLVMGILGFALVLCFAGPLLDTCNLFMMPIEMNLQSILAMYGMGFTVNISQSISTFLVLFLLGKPLLGKLDRIKTKYGMEDEENS